MFVLLKFILYTENKEKNTKPLLIIYIFLNLVSCEARGGPFLALGAYGTNLTEVHYTMLHTKYQGSRPCGFR